MILINPQKGRRIQLGAFASYVPLNVPFGIGFLSGYLLMKGKAVTVVDEEVTPLTVDMLENYVRKTHVPHIFGISCLTANINRGLEIARLIRELYPSSTIIMGGIHPTVLPDEVVKSGLVDIVVRNEGEVTLYRLYEAVKEGRDYRDIPGISYLEGGDAVHRGAAPLVDMGELPLFPYHIFERHRRRYNFGFLTSSRGCPFDCIFCSQRAITGRSYRFMKTEKVIETIDLMVNKYGERYIVFSDDNFAVHKKRMADICDAIVEHGFSKKAAFMCQCRGDAINDEALDYLKRANFNGISFGIESGSDRILDVIKKAEKVEDNVNGIMLAKKRGFKVSGTYILGLPTETRQERLMSYRMAKKLDLDYVRFNNATPYPGTELYEIAKREGGLNTGENWANLNACAVLIGGSKTEVPYVPNTCTKEELLSDVFWFNVCYTLRPARVWKFLFDKTTDTAGWIQLPDKWWLKWGEWKTLIKVGSGFFAQIARMTVYSLKVKTGVSR
ncbi:MAG: B12-binding domain-containing radical SAM protein [Deltaproteobacteria bacterium]|nr:B12-binding domain-containing radical SAM protein [Deltaproteobacteria bacterium]